MYMSSRQSKQIYKIYTILYFLVAADADTNRTAVLTYSTQQNKRLSKQSQQ